LGRLRWRLTRPRAPAYCIAPCLTAAAAARFAPTSRRTRRSSPSTRRSPPGRSCRSSRRHTASPRAEALPGIRRSASREAAESTPIAAAAERRADRARRRRGRRRCRRTAYRRKRSVRSSCREPGSQGERPGTIASPARPPRSSRHPKCRRKRPYSDPERRAAAETCAAFPPAAGTPSSFRRRAARGTG
jgi:hypothetical protein